MAGRGGSSRRASSAPSARSVSFGANPSFGNHVPAGAVVSGVVPPTQSSTGKLYYVLPKNRAKEPTVVAGGDLVASSYGGWRCGISPTGFTNLEQAVSAAAALYGGDATSSVRVIFK
jgi:hypothetical protein